MRLHRFFVENKIGNAKEFQVKSPELVHQLQRVFRLNENNEVILFDGSGCDYKCSIKEFTKETVSFFVREVVESRCVPGKDIVLYASLIKKDKFEWIVEKATELGVTKIVPIIAERSEKKDINLDRLKKIAIEASEQSGRGNVPEIGQVQALVSVLHEVRHPTVFHTEGKRVSKSDIVHLADSANIFIGPEGGWSPKEIELFHEGGAHVYSLGPQILRAETAAIATLSLLVF